MNKWIFSAALLLGPAAVLAEDAQPAAAAASQSDGSKDSENAGASMFQGDFSKDPTYVKSDSLNLKNQERVFTYTGNVEVLHGDMTLTCDNLLGSYDKDNQIQAMHANGNVVIVKGDRIRASAQKGIYEAATGLLTLTENPELQQGKSVLSADVVKIFMQEDKSSAEGNVRVKLVKEEEQEEGLSQETGKGKTKGKGGRKKKS